MSMIKCSECGKEFSDKAPACPNCGCPTEQAKTEESVSASEATDKVETTAQTETTDQAETEAAENREPNQTETDTTQKDDQPDSTEDSQKTADSGEDWRKPALIAGAVIAAFILIIIWIAAAVNTNSDTPRTDATSDTTAVTETTTKSISGISVERQNALKQAQSYLSYVSFSFNDLVSRLEDEGFSHSDAVYAVEHCDADWNEQALKSAQFYLTQSASTFSRESMIRQLELEGFAHSQAVYGADHCEADWNEQAAKSAARWMKYSSFSSRESLLEQLEREGFTHSEAVYGVEANGY